MKNSSVQRFSYWGPNRLALPLVWTLTLIAFLSAPVSARADIDAITVQRSIDRGIDYLRKTQTQRGGWQEYSGYNCGLTALCTLAWINAGVSREDPDFIRAIEYLRTFPPADTYSVSLQTLVFCAVGALEDVPRIRRNVQWLSELQKPEGARNAGAWGYTKVRGYGDPSNSQFAVLALGAAAERGVEVSPDVFNASAAYWRRVQLPGGGWSYGSGPRPSGSMTCAGIGSLIICGSSLNDLEDTAAGQLNCCGGDPSDEAVDRGLEYLSKIFTINANPGGEMLSYYYYLYAVERIGRLSGRRLIGNRDWYREGAERLVGLQDQFQGFWKGGGVVESNRDVATSFALLFLAKGKRQVVISRLDHPSLRTGVDPDPANAAFGRGSGADASSSMPLSGSLHSLVRHVERDWSRELTWQTTAAEHATAADLLKSPVLVIAGNQSLDFDAGLRDHLKAYLDQGGTILFDALAGDGCGDAAAFEQSVSSLCSQWYPQAKLERLPPSHPVWFAEAPADPANIADDYWMFGVGACCRTPVFYSPRSLACRWSRGGPLLRGADLPPGVHAGVVAGVTLGENILAYATGRELKDKLDNSMSILAEDAPIPTRGAIPIAAGAVGAGEEQVNRALPHAATIIREKIAVEVIAVDKPIALTDQSLARVGVLYLTGQTEFELDAESRRALKNYIDREGILLATPICGNEAFATSLRRELAAIASDAKLEPMPSDHPAWTTRFGGFDLTNVEIRTPNETSGAGKSVEVARRSGAPLMEAMQVNGVDTVFFSPLDLSCALESQNSIQCPGYATADAAKIVAGVILYALQQ
ncbi:DUF4159 domain-containing protein [Allorhodopirellula solitaria]|uniref:DUF4159 domain-containing protein n=1 Tax=Allorhodopirellula solitaria TaxID=2527987 RepID=A0A5C5WYI3_9BACT|nr:DUF4159 domain-containing protein [Allorhodopirellula solitaria]TWT56024.1 hypothetical protein CA85_46150 [Allorhodopirellula solitaria]